MKKKNMAEPTDTSLPLRQALQSYYRVKITEELSIRMSINKKYQNYFLNLVKIRPYPTIISVYYDLRY